MTTPTVSIIIPTSGKRITDLRRLLSCLNEQTYPDFEVLVVQTETPQPLIALGGHCVEYICNHDTGHFLSMSERLFFLESEPGLLCGTHKGLEYAKGEIIVILNDDVSFDKNWLENIISPFSFYNVGISVGRIGLASREGIPAHILKWIDDSLAANHVFHPYTLVDYGPHPQLIDPMTCFATATAFRREVIDQAGGFHPDLHPDMRYSGDGEMHVLASAVLHAWLAVYEPAAHIHHHIDPSRWDESNASFLCRLMAPTRPSFFYKRGLYGGIMRSYREIRSRARRPEPSSLLWHTAQNLRRWSTLDKIKKLKLLMAKGERDGYAWH